MRRLIAVFLLIFVGTGRGADAESSADTNGDGRVNVADAVCLLSYVFAGGRPPVLADCQACDSACPPVTTTLVTGLEQCLCFRLPCEEVVLTECPRPGEPGYGQDGHYRQGAVRRYELITLGSEDRRDWITIDYATGLMWEHRSALDILEPILSWKRALQYCEERVLGPFDDWRLPNINELISITKLFHDRPGSYFGDYGASDWFLDQKYFDVTLQEQNYCSYWSSTPAPPAPGPTAWYVMFALEWQVSYWAQDRGRSARAVRTIGRGDLELLGLAENRPPVEVPLRGDVNGDRMIGAADAVLILGYVFSGGPAPMPVECPPPDSCCPDFPARPLKTGFPPLCWNGGRWVECPPFPGQIEYAGQDGQYQTGVPRDFTLVTFGSEDVERWVTIDRATGLMWQYSYSATQLFWEDALAYCEELDLAGFSDWRLPNIFELATLANYGHSERPVTYRDYFLWKRPETGEWFYDLWSSTPSHYSAYGPGVCVWSHDAKIRDTGVEGFQGWDPYARAVRRIQPGDLEMVGLTE